jgi:uncharacterized protein
MKRLACLLTLLPLAAHAAGIDCRAARSKIDRAICASPALLAQDKILATRTEAVAAAVQQGDATNAVPFAAQAKAWLATRNAACADGDKPCLLAQYRARNLYLQILLDRVGGPNAGLPLLSLAAAQMTGTWTAGTVTMLSTADDRLGTPNEFPLDTASKGYPPNDFAAAAYGQNNLPMPGAKITNRGDETCFNGGHFNNPDTGSVVSNDSCSNFAWQPTDFVHLWTDMYGAHSENLAPQSDTEDFQIPPSLIEHDLGLSPTSTAYIGSVLLGNDPTPHPDLLIIQGKDGALYAPVVVSSPDPSQKGFNIAYQKWTPSSPDARMVILQAP